MEEEKDSNLGESPTVKNILEGKSEIKFVGNEGGSTRTRIIGGKEYVGSEYVYEVKVPNSLKPGETWTTELRWWSPTITGREPFDDPFPPDNLFIATGKGEMPFSNNPETVSKTVAEIHRQLDEQRKESEKANKESE